MGAGTPSPGGSSAFNNGYGSGSGLRGASTPGGLHLPNSAAAEAGLRAAADEATAAAGPCLTYWIKDSLYVAVTNRCNVRVCVCVCFWGWRRVGGRSINRSFHPYTPKTNPKNNTKPKNDRRCPST